MKWLKAFCGDGQSFGTQPLPGMYSRLPEWFAHPDPTTRASKTKTRQTFDMQKI